MTTVLPESVLNEEEQRLAEKYHYTYGVIRNKVLLPSLVTADSYELSRTFPTRKGDICITSYPKSGSTWLIYNVVLLTQQGKTPKGKDLAENFLWPAFGADYVWTPEQLAAFPTPRIFRSHTPYQMTIGGNPAEESNLCKYIYLARHPKDVVVSFFHFAQEWEKYTGPWEHWLNLFIGGKMWYGDWFEHVNAWWENSNLDNVLFLWYEDLKQDYDTQLQKIADFLGYPLSSELLQQIKEKTSFQSMKTDEFTSMNHSEETPNNFYRKGKVGSGKEQFSEIQSEQFDAWCAKRLKDVGFEINNFKKI